MKKRRLWGTTSRAALLVGGVPVLLLGLYLALGAGHAAAPVPETPAAACGSEDGISPPGKPLPHLAEALRDGRPLDVVAVGPATLLGPRMDVAESFPARTVQLLRDARPGWDVRLVTRAERGASAQELLVILKREIAEHHGSLVLWQTGTAEVARGKPPAELESTLREGVRSALAADSDIVLIDPPFSRLLVDRANPELYVSAFAKAASPPGAVLFSRYALMRRWDGTGQERLDHVPVAQRAATLARLHDCLAHALARGLLAASRQQAASTASR